MKTIPSSRRPFPRWPAAHGDHGDKRFGSMLKECPTAHAGLGTTKQQKRGQTLARVTVERSKFQFRCHYKLKLNFREPSKGVPEHHER